MVKDEDLKAFNDGQVAYSVRLQMWTASGGCSYPKCTEKILIGSPTAPKLIGQLAHIHSAKPNGPRYDPTYPTSKLHSFENLVSMCPTHHAVVDTLVDKWPEEKMRSIKQERERAVLEGEPVERWAPYLVTAHYINIPRLSMLATFFGLDASISTSEFDSFRDFPDAFPRVVGDLLRTIRHLHPFTVPAAAVDNLIAFPPGVLVSFDQGVRTRNIPRVNSQELRFWKLRPSLSKPPTAVFDTGETRVVMPLDMKFITTNTAYSDFASGPMKRMAGIAMLKRTDGIEGARHKKRYVASPIVLGIAVAPEVASFYGAIGPDNTQPSDL